MAIRQRLLSDNTLDSDTELAYMPEQLRRTEHSRKTERLHKPGNIRRDSRVLERPCPFPIGRWAQRYMAGSMDEILACPRFDALDA